MEEKRGEAEVEVEEVDGAFLSSLASASAHPHTLRQSDTLTCIAAPACGEVGGGKGGRKQRGKREECKPVSASNSPPFSVFIHPLSSIESILDTVVPTTVIMFEPAAEAVRGVEVYQSLHPHTKVDVYFLVYEDSIEQEKYISSLRKEAVAFEQLIHTKAEMIVPAGQDGRNAPAPHEGRSIDKEKAMEAAATSSRKGGGRGRAREGAERKVVVVDMRESRSELLFALHDRGLDVVPITLEVGDYILSPNISVERKSLSDLFQSFNSGRLFMQVEAMTKYYRQQVLLIEFSEKRAFRLVASNEIRGELSALATTSKLVILLLHFPSLRLLWSRSPRATADLFRCLKRGEEEPDPPTAAAVGTDKASAPAKHKSDGSSGDTTHNFASSQLDTLRRLPGVTSSNYRSISKKVRTLRDLLALPLPDMQSVVGARGGATLHAFVHTKAPI